MCVWGGGDVAAALWMWPPHLDVVTGQHTAPSLITHHITGNKLSSHGAQPVRSRDVQAGRGGGDGLGEVGVGDLHDACVQFVEELVDSWLVGEAAGAAFEQRDVEWWLMMAWAAAA